ncbi:hypothetical protein HMPREF2760_01805 [Corynebacterium sp. HMSC065D07]|uniref:hypothetical protein n=1 Tax=Corynebacterium sp. HMSC065D07 TaxID=1739264 RepID=UPI0008A42D17|nr:hypothetical protein [Corynebacterium sp. HMSC065D07]OFL62274.1 hypothetical protein HMPREF2760_01805 [Corynebacterium sp. HMSC065D07]
METLSNETLSLIVAALALFVSFAALFLSWKQLYEAQTSNGGRGMNLHVKRTSRDNMSEDVAREVDEALKAFHHEYVPFVMTLQVTGPAEFYQVIPYTWGRDGMSDRTGFEDPIPRFTSEDGRVSAITMIQKELLDGIRFGVAWLEPDGLGLKPGAIRLDLNGELEEWVWRYRLVAKLPFVSSGRWKRRKTPKPTIGPLTQPWEVQELRMRRRIFGKLSARRKIE